jgi:hypothetical protein
MRKSLEALDWKRQWQQTREAHQIIGIIRKLRSGQHTGWGNHAAVRMWYGYEPALTHYFNISLSISFEKVNVRRFQPIAITEQIVLPLWFGCPAVHESHRRRLLSKDYMFYSQLGWQEPPGGPDTYVWPVDKEYFLHPAVDEWRASDEYAKYASTLPRELL